MFEKQFLSSILLVVFAPLAFAQQTELETSPAALVTTPLEFQLDGVIEAINQATLSAEVSGRIESINFDVDDIVKKGEVIVRIRDREYRARLEKAKANLSEAQARFDDATREFRRVKGLLKDKVVSRAAFDKANANLESARARVFASEASVNEAQLQLDNTVIRAPYRGIVSARHVELGESTNVGQPIMSGYALGQLRVNVNLPQSKINAVRRYRQARINLLDDSASITATKLTIFPIADATNHSFKIRLDLPSAEQNLFPGMLVKVAFTTGQAQRLLIPAQSIVQRSEVIGAYVIDAEQQVSFRQLRTGVVENDRVEIIAGLDAGETVALNPVQAGIRLKAQWSNQ